MSVQEVPESAFDERSRHASVRAGVAHSVLLAGLILATEILQQVLKNRHILVDLGLGGTAPVIGLYLLFAVITGAVAGSLLRTPRLRALALALVYYLLISLKMFWISARLLDQPPLAAGFVAVTAVSFAGLHVVIGRFRLPATLPALFVLAYVHACHLIASKWITEGGDLKAYLLSPRTFAVCAICAVAFIACTAAQTLVERRRGSAWGPRVQVGLLLLTLVVAVFHSQFRAVASNPKRAADPLAPDIYVLSFDALRRDAFEAYAATAPARFKAFVEHSTQFVDVLAEGAWTYDILANNTFARGKQRTCSDSLPEQLRARGYNTMMLLGRYGARMQGSDCYDYYYSGDGSTLARRFALPRLVATVASPESSLRGAAMPAALLLDRLERRLGTPAPLFAYLHFLELHAPYVAPGQEHDADHADAISKYMRDCYEVACDPTKPENARSIQLARRTYDATLVALDQITAQVDELARRRGRPYRIIITADHGELFGEYGGFAHVGGFVPELLNIPFIVYDSRAPRAGRRCELMTTSEALLATATDGVYPVRDRLTIVAPPLGTATFDRPTDTVRYEIDAATRKHVGTWRNIHREPTGTLPFPLADCPAGP